MLIGSVIPGLGGGGQQSSRIEAIRVVADPATNSLLVRARPIDMLTIRRLLTSELDRRDNNSDALVKTHHIQLKNANAVEVADLVRQVFAESMKAPQQSTQGSPGGFPFGFGGGQRPVDSTGGSKNVMLTVGADIHTNSIYLACPTTLYNEIATMVKTIEENSQDIRETMQIVSIKDIDPVTLQQVIDAFSGRATQQSRFSQQTATGFQGQFAPGAFGTSMRGLGFQSGFQPGMGGGGAFALPIPIGIPGAGGGIPSIGGPGTGGPGSGIRFPGGGGGGGPIRGGGGGKGRVSLERGPDFFVSRVTDDPPVRILFDPSEEQQEPPQPENDLFKRPSYSVNPLRLTSLTQPDEPGSEVVMTDATGTWRGTWVSTGSLITMTFPDRAVYNGRITGNRITGTARNSLNQVWRWDVTRVGPGTDFLGSEDLPGFGKLAFHFVGQAPRDEGLTSPRMGIQAEIIPQSGIMILRGNSKEDIRAILQIIELIRREAQPTLIEIELVPVRLGDPVDITETLKAIYSRLGITPYSTQILPPTTAPGGPAAPAGPGVVPAVAASTIPQPSNILFLPQIRLGGILVVASKARMKEIRDHIQRLDQMPSDLHHVVPIKLKRASAPRVAASLNTFYSTRFPLPGNVNAIRIAADDGSNSLLVQAAPADLKEIQRLVEHIDNTASDARAEVRVIQLKAAVATDLAALLQAAIANGVLTINAPPVQPGAATAGAVPPQVGPGGTVQYNLMSKDNTLVFRPSKSPNGKPIEARILEDIRINPDIRINALLVSAPSESMELIQALINEMDVPPMAKAEIRVFQLKKTDATQFANMLRTLFLGTTTTGTTTPAGPGPAGPGGGTQQRPPIFTINDQLSPGAPIIDVRVTIDERTNSLVVAGAYTDILVVESIFDRIENAKVPERLSEAIRLRNSQAADVANAVTTFINQLTTEYRTYNQGTNFLSLQRDVVVVAEPISNSLLINATPEYFDKVVQLIAKIDTAPPQVVIQVVVAEVTMTGSEEFGMEIGLQTPLVFNRGSLATAATPGIVFPTAGATYATFTPGYAFTNPATSVSGNNVLQNPSAVGFQGLSNTGVGRISPTSNIGGFVFSAGSDTVNVLIRALKVQGRLTVLSRPQITTLDNQTAYINIGQNVPVVGQVTQPTTATTLPFVSIDRYDIGVNMQVTPRITPDGRVLMRVIPEVSSISSSQINLGNGATGTIFNKQHLETTVVATDGETIILGGLITKNDNKTENKIPWVGDLPVVGAAFRYRTYNNTKTELIFIMTPHIIRNRGEMERVLIEEASRIDWKVSDLVRVHGPQNCMPFMPNIYPEPHGHHGHGRPYRSYPGVPAVAEWETQPDTPPTTLPAPTPVPPKPAPVPPKPAPMPVAPMAEPTAPLPLLLPEVAPEPARAPIGRGGLLKSLLNRRSETVVVRDMVETPLMRTTVEYSTPIPTSPLPEVISTGAVSPRPGDVGPSLSSPLPPITNIEP
jgi:type II secretion system protein D